MNIQKSELKPKKLTLNKELIFNVFIRLPYTQKQDLCVQRSFLIKIH